MGGRELWAREAGVRGARTQSSPPLDRSTPVCTGPRARQGRRGGRSAAAAWCSGGGYARAGVNGIDVREHA